MNSLQGTFLENNLSVTLDEWLRYHQSNLHYIRYKNSVMQKNPFDLMIYDEIIWDIRPTVIIEIGGLHGGFALWLRDHTHMIGINAKIITIDINSGTAENISRFGVSGMIGITGNCNSPDVINKVKQYIGSTDVVMVIEDSSHDLENTFRVLENYKNIVTIGSYFIVEDGICDVLNFGPVPGPMRAVEKWIVSNPNYQIDRSKEKYIMTYNPKGYLIRIS